MDLPLKLAAARAFMCQGYLVRLNLDLSEPALGQLEKRLLIDITDIDVMAIKYNYDFTPYTICMSCKGGEAKNLSAIRESFYLKGVMDYFGGHRGYIVIGKKPVMSHARILATKLGITILQGGEFDDWCKSAQDSCQMDYSYFWQKQTHDKYKHEFTKIKQVETLRSYLSGDYWFYNDFRNIQNLIAHTKRVKEFLKKPSLPVRLMILEVALHFALSVLGLCGYVYGAGVKDIRDHVAAYLFGGVTSLRSRQDLYKKVDTLLKNVGVVQEDSPKLPDLLPDYTDRLIEIVYRWISKPWASIYVPQVIQLHAWSAVLSDMNSEWDKHDKIGTIYNDISLKFADDVLEFISSTTLVYRENII